MANAHLAQNILKNNHLTDNVVLTLSPEEAHFLILLTGKVSGSPYTSIRKYSDNIYNALTDTTDLAPGYAMPEYFHGEISAIDYKCGDEERLGLLRRRVSLYNPSDNV